MTHHDTFIVCRLDQQLPLVLHLHGRQVILKMLSMGACSGQDSLGTINSDANAKNIVKFIHCFVNRFASRKLRDPTF